jgi:sugar transferase (PEP-CTERM/EpsH1 system associated)
MKRFRIIHVLHRMGAGGTELALRKIVAGLGPDRFEHIICTVAPIPENELTGNARFISLERTGKKTGSLVAGLARIFLREKPDVVHSRNWGAIEAVMAARLARVPRVIHSEHGRDINTMHGDPLRRRVFRHICYSLANEVFAVSNELRQHYARQVGVSPRKIKVIPNGVDVTRFCPDAMTRYRLRSLMEVTEQEIVLGTIGRLDPIKDHATLLLAAEQIIAAGVPLKVVIVGDGPERGRLQTAIEASPALRHRAILAGESNAPEDWLNALDVFTLPSLSEGMSNTILEAMATGLPSVVTTVGANPDLVDDGKTGFLFKPRDAKALADRVITLAHQGSLRYELGGHARRKVELEFSLQRMMENYLNLYTVAATQQHAVATELGRV